MNAGKLKAGPPNVNAEHFRWELEIPTALADSLIGTMSVAPYGDYLRAREAGARNPNQ